MAAAAHAIASSVIARASRFTKRVLTAEARPAANVGGARGASSRRAATESPQSFPFRDMAVAGLQRLVERQAGVDRFQVRRRLLEVGAGHVRASRAPSH